jgi:regulator of cell morphogenesis and NO signaling
MGWDTRRPPGYPPDVDEGEATEHDGADERTRESAHCDADAADRQGAGPPESVGDIVARDYRTAAVVGRHGIDFCCGGAASLDEACGREQVDREAIQHELAAVTSTPRRRPDEDPSTWTLTRLADHIVAVHHRYLRENLPQVGAYLRRIAEVHGRQHPELARMLTIHDPMAVELTDHLREEEEAFFPAVRRLQTAARDGEAPAPGDADTLRSLTGRLSQEHDRVGTALHELRDLSMGYALPYDACATYSAAYQSLGGLEADLHRHVHLENNLLFPRAAAVLAALPG